MALSKITTESLLDGEITTAKFATNVGGKVVQIVNTQTGAAATGTTVMLNDDTIPQITEGDEFMTLAITPTSATNRLKFEVSAMTDNNTAESIMIAALFVGTTANALASWVYHRDSVQHYARAHFHGAYNMVAGGTSELTFRVRIGSNLASTTTFNGAGGSRTVGGVASSNITITEYST